MIGIYKILNIKTNKCYIGQSTCIENRIATHFKLLETDNHINSSGLRDKLQNSYNKYGKDSFIWEIIEECSKEDLNNREKYWINYYNSLENGYNQTVGGEGGDTFSGRSLEERDRTRKQLSESNSGKIYINKEGQELHVLKEEFDRIYVKQGWSVGFSENHKASLKENHKGFTGLKKTREHNEKLRQRFKGISLSEEHKKHLSEAHIGYIMPIEQKNKIRNNSIDRIRVTNDIEEKAIKKDDLNNFLLLNKDWHIGTKPRAKRK